MADKNNRTKTRRVIGKHPNEYQAIDGFYDLREYDIPEKEFMSFWKIQIFLNSWEQSRKKGYKVPDNIRGVSAQYQTALFEYPLKTNIN